MRQTVKMSQHGTLQVKAMLFEITKHLISPHSAPVASQGDTPIRQIGGQTPGFFLPDLPMDQQVGRVNLLGGQTASSQPDALTGLAEVTTEGLPATFFIEPDPSIAFLAQGRHSAKFAVSDQENGCTSGDQLEHIGQQSQLLMGTAVSSDVFDPSPGDGNGSLAVRQTDDQQLVPKADLGAIHKQTDFSQMLELRCQPLSSDGFIPFPHSNGRVVQQSAQAAGQAQQLRWTGYLPSNPAQTYRTTLVDPHDQPDEIAGLSDALARSHRLNPLKPGMIESVGRHRVAPFRKMVRENRFYWTSRADQLFCC